MKYQKPTNKVQDFDNEKNTDLAPKKSEGRATDEDRNSEAGSDDFESGEELEEDDET